MKKNAILSEQCHTVRTIPKSNRNTVDTEAKSTPLTCIHR